MNPGKIPNANDLKTDIVIIGGGGAGLAAAAAAAEKGADVIVLEKRSRPGGNSALAEGIFAAESPAQKRMMIDARTDELFKIAMDYAHWKIDPRILRVFIDKSGDTIRWLEGMGVQFDLIPPMYPNQGIRTWHCPRGSGNAIVQTLTEYCERSGVRILCNSPAKRILTAEDGKVSGVLATTKDGELRIGAKSAVIATGGYASNKELLKKYCPAYSEDVHIRGIGFTGDGLLMANEIGATTEGLGIIQFGDLFFPGSPVIQAIAGEPNTVWVNKKGHRFIDESIITFSFAVCGNAIARQPDKTGYSLFDQGIKQLLLNEGPVRRRLSLEGTNNPRFIRSFEPAELENKLQLEADAGRIKIAASPEEIGGWIGAAPEVIRNTIEEYNSFCDQGRDGLLAKDRKYLQALRTPPYYAVKFGCGILGTIGGIKINHKMEVLNQHDNPIPGCYAAGVDTGGWESDTYCLVLSGSTYGFAINSGRICGENAVKYLALNK